jgi:chromosomal replication initiator protein
MLTPTIAEIMLATALRFEIKIEDLRGESHERQYARPRQIAMYLCHVWDIGSFSMIGRHIGDRHPSTVIHAVRTISHLIVTDRAISEAISDIHIITARMVRARDHEHRLEAVA